MEDLDAASARGCAGVVRDVLRGCQRGARRSPATSMPETAKAQRSRPTSATSRPARPWRRHSAWIAKREGTHRGQVHDRVPQSRIYMVWNIPEYGEAEDAPTTSIWSATSWRSGKTSRLYKRLVYDDQIATSAQRLRRSARDRRHQFYRGRDGAPGSRMWLRSRRHSTEELERFLSRRTRHRRRARAGQDKLPSKLHPPASSGSAVSAASPMRWHRVEIYGGRPDFYKQQLRRVQPRPRSEHLHEAAQRVAVATAVYVLDGPSLRQSTTTVATHGGSLPRRAREPGDCACVSASREIQRKPSYPMAWS